MVDIIGHGKTEESVDIERYRIEQMANDLKCIFEKLSVSKAHVLGYSMGGRLALTFANLYPQCVCSLILESASPGLVDGRRAIRAKKERSAISGTYFERWYRSLCGELGKHYVI